MTDKNDPTKTSDTGHIWDGNLRELTNQPPKWWMISLFLSAIFIVGYILLYPSLPTLSGYTKGILGWTQIKEYKEDLKSIEQIRAPFEDKIKNMPVAAVLADKDLTNFVIHSAKVLFGDRCAPCHGTGGSGNPGYPVLADDDWLYGGSIDDLQQTITDGRAGMMPGFSAMLTESQINDLTQYMLALSKGNEHAAGKEMFTTAGCSGCHGEDAKGVQMMGSANLTDVIWRFTPATEESIRYTIANGVNNPGSTETRQAIMPGFKQQLTETEIKKLAIYVHQLGGGQ